VGRARSALEKDRLTMQRGEPVALFTLLLYASALASERFARVRALRAWPILRELFPVLVVTLAAHWLAHWFTAVSDIRPPRFFPCLVISAAFAIPAALVPRLRARRVVAGVTIAVLAFLGLADALYFRFFGGILPLVGAANAKQAWEVVSSIVALLVPRDALFVVTLGSGIWLAATRPDASPAATGRPRRNAFIGAIAVTGLAVVVLALDVRSWLGQRHSDKILTWRARLHQTGLFGGHARDIARLVRASAVDSKPPPPEKVQALARYLEANEAKAPDELFGVARGKNLLIVQVEALQQWVIDTRANGVEITPFLNRLKRERAYYFSGLWDQTMVSPTADAEYLTLNSLHPMPDSAVAFRFANNDFVTLPKIMAQSGYSTLSAHAYERGFWNRATVHPRYGFRESHFDRELGKEPKIGWGMGDKQFLLRALERVDRIRAPFLAFFITLTSHHPYGYLPPEERHIDTSGLPEMLAGYVASMRYLDEAMAGLFAALAQRPYAKDTVVVFYGDHESRIALDHAAEEQARRGLSLDAQTVKDLARRSFATRKVPLFVVLPDAKEPRTFEQVGGQIDISPTLLHLFGVPKPKSMMGKPLVGSGGAVFRGEGSAVEGERYRLADGTCRTLRGQGLPVSECESLGKRGDEQLQASWAITQYNLARRLAGERSASR
jgi:phosphoglycerol transferase MdoB-like AlkP superfamily enzyme